MYVSTPTSTLGRKKNMEHSVTGEVSFRVIIITVSMLKVNDGTENKTVKQETKSTVTVRFKMYLKGEWKIVLLYSNLFYYV